MAQWAEEKRYLSEKSTAMPGRFSLVITPFLRQPLECLTDRRVREVDAQKSAQIGWTDGVVVNWLGHTVDEDPAGTIVLFPADKKGKEFSREKWDPAVDATPVLSEKLNSKSRARENTLDFKDFPGGFIKLVGSNSPSNLKSTSAKKLIVEEPDDCNLNIKGQGDSITLLEERGKTFPDKKMLVGGTPTIKGVSAIEGRMKLSDQRYWNVPCHHCGEAHAMEWKNVRWSEDPARSHEVFGTALTATARYVCPACGAEWSDAEKNANVRRGAWVATAEFRGAAGFYFNELMSPFSESRLERLAEKYLVAKHELDTNGDVGPMIAFWNTTLGLTWEYQGTTPEAKDLAQRGEDYPEWWVPWGGLVITVGVDVQHNRLAATVKAWGEGEESWLVWAGEFYGNVMEGDAVWDELDRSVVFRAYKHVSGAELAVSAVSVDSSDGQTADAVYKWARRANRRFGVPRVMPIKGSTTEASEIFRAPGKPLDVTSQHKAAKHGLRPYMVGVSRAKDLILGADELAGRINLRNPDGATGRGPGRMHWYRSISTSRPDYFEQLTAEVKAPARSQPKGKKVWLRKAGARNEFLDCEVYALHAARALRTDTYTAARWAEIRKALLQDNLFAPAQPAAEEPNNSPEVVADPGEAGASDPDRNGAGTATPGSAASVQQPTPVVPAKPITPRPVPAGRRVRSPGIRL